MLITYVSIPFLLACITFAAPTPSELIDAEIENGNMSPASSNVLEKRGISCRPPPVSVSPQINAYQLDGHAPYSVFQTFKYSSDPGKVLNCDNGLIKCRYYGCLHCHETDSVNKLGVCSDKDESNFKNDPGFNACPLLQSIYSQTDSSTTVADGGANPEGVTTAGGSTNGANTNTAAGNQTNHCPWGNTNGPTCSSGISHDVNDDNPVLTELIATRQGQCRKSLIFGQSAPWRAYKITERRYSDRDCSNLWDCGGDQTCQCSQVDSSLWNGLTSFFNGNGFYKMMCGGRPVTLGP